MRIDSRLSRMLHVLLHMARHNRPFTSDQIAKMLNTNPVVVRRTMAGLRDAGHVKSVKGHGGGWSIAKKTDQISLLDIYSAVGDMRLFAIGNDSEFPNCAAEHVVNRAVDEALDQAETLIRNRFMQISLFELAQDFDKLCVQAGWTEDGPQKQT